MRLFFFRALLFFKNLMRNQKSNMQKNKKSLTRITIENRWSCKNGYSEKIILRTWHNNTSHSSSFFRIFHNKMIQPIFWCYRFSRNNRITKDITTFPLKHRISRYHRMLFSRHSFAMNAQTQQKNSMKYLATTSEDPSYRCSFHVFNVPF